MAGHKYSSKVFLYVALAAFPSFIVALILLWQTDISHYGKLLCSLLLGLSVTGFSLAVKNQINFQLHTLTNLVEAIHQGDFSLRGIASAQDDPLAELVQQINQLAESLRLQRLASEEAYRLLEKVIKEINVAIIAFDGEQKIKLVNPAAEKLLANSSMKLIGKEANEVKLALNMFSKETQVIEREFPGAKGRWQVRLDTYRESGEQRQLLFINDVKQVLRNEELKAWKNIMRVISHEVNNSLYPVSSLSQTLTSVVNQQPLADDWLDDVNQGLSIIGERSERLNEFIKRYAKVAKLPEPRKQHVTAISVVEKVMQLFDKENIADETNLLNSKLFVDPTMLEHVLINLIKNGFEAGDEVVVSNLLDSKRLTIRVVDNGPGISNIDNLFVPFYSTKEKGSGIGLVLCRQIVEAHEGDISLTNIDGGGCCAEISFPLSMAQ